MDNYHKILKPGQVVQVSDSQGNSWNFGVKFLLAGNRVLCERLGDEDNQLDKNKTDVRLSIPHDAGIYVIPIKIVKEFPDSCEYKFLLDKKHDYVQRRDYYRLINPEIRVRCQIHDEDLREVKVSDISGAGIGLIVNRRVKEGTAVRLEITLFDKSTVHVVGRSLRVSPIKGKDEYIMGVSFTRIGKSDRAKIMRHIFNEQLREKMQ